MSICDSAEDAKALKIVTDSTRIIHTLEAKIPVDKYPQLVPCTSDTMDYQKYVYYTALLDEVNHV